MPTACRLAYLPGRLARLDNTSGRIPVTRMRYARSEPNQRAALLEQAGRGDELADP
jgi:hypothetical protein